MNFLRITCSLFLVHELDVKVEDLLLDFTLRQFQLLSPTHHVAQVPHLVERKWGSERVCVCV